MQCLKHPGLYRYNADVKLYWFLFPFTCRFSSVHHSISTKVSILHTFLIWLIENTQVNIHTNSHRYAPSNKIKHTTEGPYKWPVRNGQDPHLWSNFFPSKNLLWIQVCKVSGFHKSAIAIRIRVFQCIFSTDGSVINRVYLKLPNYFVAQQLRHAMELDWVSCAP